MQEKMRKRIKYLLLACILFLLSFSQILISFAGKVGSSILAVMATENEGGEIGGDGDGESTENEGGEIGGDGVGAAPGAAGGAIGGDGVGEDGGTSEGLDIHFYPLGYNKNNADGQQEYQVAGSGDSFIITVGSTQILVDAGASQESAKAIVRQMQQVCGYNEADGTYQDTTWEYIIATHPDSDHIAAFTSSDPTVQPIFSTLFLGPTAPLKLGKLIDFDVLQDETARENYAKWEQLKTNLETKPHYARYVAARELLKLQYGAEVYSPISKVCKTHRDYVEENEGKITDEGLWKNRATPIPLADGITLNFLYNYHNDHRTGSSVPESADINNLSVCFTIDCEKKDGGVERFLFTGDLEEFDSSKDDKKEAREKKRIYGESDLVKYNPWLKEGVIFYKAAHHGSYTSSSDELMAAIKPKYVVISAVAGDPKHGFPKQQALDSIYRYTENVYITAVNVDGVTQNYYGDIKINYANGEYSMKVGNPDIYKDGQIVPFHETEWFKKNRQMPVHVSTLSGVDENVSCLGNSSIVKCGNTEVVVDCGLMSNTEARGESRVFLDKINDYSTDDKIEYLLISSSQIVDIQQLIDVGKNGEVKGLLSILNVENIVLFEDYRKAKPREDSAYAKLCEALETAEEQGVNIIDARDLTEEIEVDEGLYISALLDKGEFYGYCVEYQDKDFLFPQILEEDKDDFLLGEEYDIVYMRVPNFGYVGGLSESLMTSLNKRSLHLAVNGIAGAGKSLGADTTAVMLTKAYCDMLCRNARETFLTSCQDEGKTVDHAGDIIFTMWHKEGEKPTYDMYGCKDGSINENHLFSSEYYQDAA